MANAFHGNRFILDTAGATLLNANLAQLPYPIKTTGIRWVGATTNAHEAIIQDSDSNVIWHDKEATAVLGQTKESRIPIHLSKDFKITTLGSGTVYVYIEV